MGREDQLLTNLTVRRVAIANAQRAICVVVPADENAAKHPGTYRSGWCVPQYRQKVNAPGGCSH
eukprot:12932905-Prorocentrum_lima.AAC.1